MVISMEMKDKVEELNRWRASTLDESRPHAVEQQKNLGKLTARARNELLFDKGTFLEFGQLAGACNVPCKKTPADGAIVGVGKIDGRRVAVVNYDFTVLGGSQSDLNHAKTDHVHKIAREQGIPIVYLLDGGGFRAQDMGGFGYYYPKMWYSQVHLSGWVPLIGAALGPCYAGHANLAGLCDFLTMNEKTASIGVGGTHLVKTSLSVDVTPFDLGGASIHYDNTGVADMLGHNDEECIVQLKEYLSFFPTNSSEMPPVISCDDPADRREEILHKIVPFDQKRAYDMYRVIRAIVDHGKIFDIKPNWAKNMITCLARLNGRPVGIVANQTFHMAGIIDTPASEKMAHFVDMCDAFNIPLILLGDIPGFMVGPESERTGLVRRSMKILYTLGHCTVPIICVLIRKSFGAGGYVMASRGYNPSLFLAWPTAEMGGMGIGGAVEILHGKRIAESENPDEFRLKLIEELRDTMRAFPTAKNYGFDNVIDPMDTRPILINALKLLTTKNPNLPPKKHGIMPF